MVLSRRTSAWQPKLLTGCELAGWRRLSSAFDCPRGRPLLYSECPQLPLTGYCYQTRILVMSKTLPLSEVKAKLSEIVEEVASTHERVTLTRNGRPVAVLLSPDDLDAVEETVSILSDPAAVRAIQEGRAAIEAGDTYSRSDLEALRTRLRSQSA